MHRDVDPGSIPMRNVAHVVVLIGALATGAAVGLPAAGKHASAEPGAARWTTMQRAALWKAGAAMRKRVDPVVALDTAGLAALIEVSDQWPAAWPVWTQIREARAITGWEEVRTLLDLTRKIAETSGAPTRSAFVTPLIELIERGDLEATLPAQPDAQTLGEIEAAHEAERSLAAAIDLYYLENRELPATLSQLVLPSKRTNAPIAVRIPKDPWGEAYEYQVLRAGTSDYRLTSKGPDRQLGTRDDITLPEPDSR
jgi:hypothetical protein